MSDVKEQLLQLHDMFSRFIWSRSTGTHDEHLTTTNVAHEEFYEFWEHEEQEEYGEDLPYTDLPTSMGFNMTNQHHRHQKLTAL